jgi:hypothetical protein
MTSAIVPDVWNATLRGNMAKCLKSPPDNNLAKCYSQPYAYEFLDVPTFVVQSLNDPASYSFCWRPSCSIKRNTPGERAPSAASVLNLYKILTTVSPLPVLGS